MPDPILRVALVLLLTPLPAKAAAQDSTVAPLTERAPRGRSLGATLDRYLVGGRSYTAVSLRGVTLTPADWGPDFGIGVLPSVSDQGGAAMTLDLGVAYDLRVPSSLLLLKAGTTGILELSQSGAVVGAYAGGGLIAPLSGGVGLRLEATRRWYLPMEGEEPVWLISFGLTSIPFRR